MSILAGLEARCARAEAEGKPVTAVPTPHLRLVLDTLAETRRAVTAIQAQMEER